MLYRGLSKLTTIGARAIFTQLPKLKHINLSNSRRLNDHPFVVSAKEGLKLESYILNDMPLLTDVSLNELSKISTLKEITICMTPGEGKYSHITDGMQRLLGKHCKKLTKVVYTNALWLTDAGLLSLIKNCTELNELCIGMVHKNVKGTVSFSYMERGPSDKTLLAILENLRKLKTLKIINAGLLQLSTRFVLEMMKPKLLSKLLKGCVLKNLSLVNCEHIRVQGFKKLVLTALQTSVKVVDVSGCSCITHADISEIISIKPYYGFSKTKNGFEPLHKKFKRQDDFTTRLNRRRAMCIHIARYYRGYKGRQWFLLCRKSAIKIQCMIRCNIARKVRVQKYEEWRRKRAMEFAAQLQGRNLHVCWKSWTDMIKEIKEEKVRIAKRFARNIVLRYVRILWGTWKEYVLWKARLKRLARRVMMQKTFMYFEMFRNQVDISIENRLHPFATNIQKCFRGFIVRLKIFRKHRQDVKMNLLKRWANRGDILTKIQKWWKGNARRVNLEKKLYRESNLRNSSVRVKSAKLHINNRKGQYQVVLSWLREINDEMNQITLEQQLRQKAFEKNRQDIYKQDKRVEVLRQMIRNSRSMLEAPLLQRLGTKHEWTAKISYLAGRDHVAFDGGLLGFGKANPTMWNYPTNIHLFRTPERTMETIERALNALGESRTKEHVLENIYKATFRTLLDERQKLDVIQNEHVKRMNILNIRLKDLHHWKIMVNESLRRYSNNSSMFFSLTMMKRWDLYLKSKSLKDRSNVHAIKLQSFIRKIQAKRKVDNIRYVKRKKENLNYLNFRYVIRTFIEDSMAKGLDKIFDKAKEQIAERKREQQRKEKSVAPRLIKKILAASITKAHESLLAFYEREDYRYRLTVMEMVAARLQSSWRGRQERARLFEENRKNKGSSQPIACGWESTIIARPDGLVYTCGIGNACGIYWKKPDINLTLTSIPKLNVMAFKVSMVAAGGSHVLMMLSNYSVLSMGNNSKGQLGLGEDFPTDGTASAESVVLPDNLLAASVYAGTAHSMILTTDGCAFSFGFNSKVSKFYCPKPYLTCPRLADIPTCLN